MSTKTKTQLIAEIQAENGGIGAANAVFQDEMPRYECEFWDYKQEFSGDVNGMAELCRDIAAFHNSYGGFLFVGVSDSFELIGTAVDINQQTVKQKVKHYFGVDVAARVDSIQISGKRLVIVSVPKRNSSAPVVVAVRQGPTLLNGRPLFSTGAVYFRSQDSSQLIRGSEDLQFLASTRAHALEIKGATTELKQSNLPDRSAICPKLIGRADTKAELWLWLADRHSRYRVLAGPGGFGKTSSAYYFAEDVLEAATLGFMQVLWLSAKSKQFSALSNSFVSMPYVETRGDAFSDVASLLDVLAESVAISEIEWAEASEHERIGLLGSALENIPSFVVLDDLDSLTPDEQRLIVQLVMQIGSKESRFLLTTRNNYMAPASSTTLLPGLEGDEFAEYVGVLSERFERSLTGKERGRLEVATQGSPLFAESVFRLMRLGNKFDDALKAWQGKDGEAARAACFKREVLQLSFKGRRVLFAMSRVDSASLPELCKFAELERVEVEQAIQELAQLFLCSGEDIAGEPRFSVQENLSRLLGEEKADLVPEHLQIDRRISALRKEAAGAGKSRGKNAPTAAAINQAMAQLGVDNRGACQTVDEALDRSPGSADLWMVRARCYAESVPLDVEAVRASFEKSYLLGKREYRLFEKWIEFELLKGNSNAAVDVGEKGLKTIDAPGFTWYIWLGKAYSKRADERLRRGENEDATNDFRSALKYNGIALRQAPVSAKASIESAISVAGEKLWDSVPIQKGAAGLLAVLRAAKDATYAGDSRDIWGERALISAGQLLRDRRSKFAATDIDAIVFLTNEIARRLSPGMRARLESLLSRFGDE